MADVMSLGAARARAADDNRAWSPVECLLDAVEDIKSGKVKCDKLLVLRVNVDDDKFVVGYNAANIKASEIIATLEIAKAMVLEEMGYT